MIKKKAYAIQMTYEVSDSEKQEAEKSLLYFTHCIKLLKLAKDHLDVMYTPFSENPDITPEEIIKNRAAIRRFRDKSIDNFNDFKAVAFKCVASMKTFSFDTQTLKLMKSFISSVDDLEYHVNLFADLFDDLKSIDFVKDVIEAMDKIKKESSDVEEIVDERIKSHIQSDILAKSWIDGVSSNLQMSIEEKTPLVIDLFNKRQEELANAISNIRKK